MRVFLVAIGCAIAAAQTLPIFKSGTEIVSVPLTVTVRDERLSIDDLTAGEFKLWEDGSPQRIDFLERDRRPLSLCLVVDGSGSMGDGAKQAFAVAAVRSAVARLDPTDEIGVVVFARTAERVVPWTAVRNIASVSWTLPAAGETALNDALRVALAEIDEAHNPRRAILLVTDGFENASRSSMKEVVTTRRQSEALVYAFAITSGAAVSTPNGGIFDRAIPSSSAAGPVSSVAPTTGGSMLPALVGDSGGTTFRIQRGLDVSAAVSSLIEELRNQFTLGYTPQGPLDGRYRRIKIESTRRGIHVRHRTGYLALPSSPQ